MYPYDFINSLRSIDHRKIFVVMPLARKYDNIYKILIDSAVKSANRKLGLTKKNEKLFIRRADDDVTTRTGWNKVLDDLTSARIVLGVLTDKNPNVFYELGIAHSTQTITRQLLIADKDYKPAFDTKDLIFYKYDQDDWKSSIKDLSKWIMEVFRNFDITREFTINKARMSIGPYDFELIMKRCLVSHFAVKSNDNQWKKQFERDEGEGSFERFVIGIKNLCNAGLLGLNTLSKPNEQGVKVEFSYYWTGLGNDVLRMMGLISEDELVKRRQELPDFFEG
jgi:hypothetical protein